MEHVNLYYLVTGQQLDKTRLLCYVTNNRKRNLILKKIPNVCHSLLLSTATKNTIRSIILLCYYLLGSIISSV